MAVILVAQLLQWVDYELHNQGTTVWFPAAARDLFYSSMHSKQLQASLSVLDSGHREFFSVEQSGQC
jgi:hypothetical protein